MTVSRRTSRLFLAPLIITGVTAFLPGIAQGGVLYANDFSSSAAGITIFDPSLFSLVQSPFTGSQALQIRMPHSESYYAYPNVSLSEGQVAATPVVTESVRLGLASPASGTTTHGADVGIEIDDNNLNEVAGMTLSWDPDGNSSGGGLTPKHVYLIPWSPGATNGGTPKFSVFDLSGSAVELADLTAFGDRSISMSANYATGEVTYRLDGRLLPFTGTFNPSDFSGMGFAIMEVGALENAGDMPRAIFDDYALSSASVPEPTGVATLAGATLLLLPRGRGRWFRTRDGGFDAAR